MVLGGSGVVVGSSRWFGLVLGGCGVVLLLPLCHIFQPTDAY